MPKRHAQAIVPPSASAPKLSKKKKKRAIKEASNSFAEEEDALEVLPTNEAVEMLSLVLEDAPEATGHAIAAAPGTADKPEHFFAWLIAPMAPQTFFDDMHERRPFHIKRPDHDEFYGGWFGRRQIDALLRAGKLRYTEHLDVTSYTDGERQTHNGEGVAPAAEVWKRFEAGCSLRLSWPQRHSDEVWGMVALLEEYFGCGGGCNAYLTPAHSQGFAPHFDDVDAFVLQVEGSKRWRVYAPRSEEEALPRFSSPNFAQEDIGVPLAELTLRAGELLYLPRGWIHQAESVDEDSLHLTLSTGRQHTYRDLLQLAVEGALEDMAAAQPEWRRSLPRDYLEYMGVVHSDAADVRRAAFHEKMHGMMSALLASLPLDAACDQFAATRLMHDRLPPRLPLADAAHVPAQDDAQTAVGLGSRVRLVARHAARLAVEGEVAALYFHTLNPKVFHADAEPQRIDFSLEAAPALEKILLAYPKYVTVGKLPGDNDAQRLDVAQAMAEARLLLVRPPKEAA
eukprot:Transcript_11123.p2 GENE.Transcript_11123~~Transcript_11123.p2  ORF type:complete len:511 (-),score=238.91 Transcript_11123:80-1612(-)